MGKGDKRSKRGKIHIGTSGVARPKKKKAPVKKAADKPAEGKKAAPKKAAKKAAKKAE
jgi:30S ribosomal protein S31